MRRALVLAAALALLAPAVAQAATLSETRARGAALREAAVEAREDDGGGARVFSCRRSGARALPSARRFLCKVGWTYTQKEVSREYTDCNEDPCSFDKVYVSKDETRNCTANVSATYIHPRKRRLTVVLSGRHCDPFFSDASSGQE